MKFWAFGQYCLPKVSNGFKYAIITNTQLSAINLTEVAVGKKS